MTIKELYKKYYMHDSAITHIDYSEKTQCLEMEIDFCYWAQEWYVDGDPELMKMKISFEGVEEYSGPLGDIDYFNIYDGLVKDDKYYLYFVDEYNDQHYELNISPKNIEVEIIEMFED